MIFKKQKYNKGEFIQISSDIICNKQMSPVARAVLIYLLSNKPDWNYTEDGICEYFGIGKCQLRNALKELKDFGHLKTTRIYVKGKFKRYNYDIYEDPNENEDYNNQPFLGDK